MGTRLPPEVTFNMGHTVLNTRYNDFLISTDICKVNSFEKVGMFTHLQYLTDFCNTRVLQSAS
jgi:hypothetical protein